MQNKVKCVCGERKWGRRERVRERERGEREEIERRRKREGDFSLLASGSVFGGLHISEN